MNYETCGRPADDLRKTRESPPKAPRKTPEKSLPRPSLKGGGREGRLYCGDISQSGIEALFARKEKIVNFVQ